MNLLAVKHKMTRLGLRHVDLARLWRVARPSVTHFLAGNFKSAYLARCTEDFLRWQDTTILSKLAQATRRSRPLARRNGHPARP